MALISSQERGLVEGIQSPYRPHLKGPQKTDTTLLQAES